MTLELALLPQPAPAADHAQWRLETFQMVNWGGFHGRHDVHLSPGSTLLSGASGSGKSTLLDAYIALMMPSDTPFNGASNEAAGRARSAEQRNLLTYLRGKMDTSRVDGSEEMRDQVLRGSDGGPVWGALASTFINSEGRRYTILRIYFLKPGATVNSDVATTFATFEGYLDLSRLEPFAQTRFDKRVLKTNIAGLTTFTTFREFENHIHTRLCIGAGGDGRKAMRLLARVQAGMEVKRVDGLYKTMVLERPITYQIADDALEHFVHLETSYAKMLDEARKVKALQRLPDLQQDFAGAEAKVRLIQQFGADMDGPSPFHLWRLRIERGLLDTAVETNRREQRQTTLSHRQAEKDEARYQEQLAQIAKDKRTNGGGAIDERRAEIESLGRSRDTAYQANLKFQARTEPLGNVVPETAEQFDTMQGEAADFLSGFAERESDLQSKEEAVREELAPLSHRKNELLAERASLQGRIGMVPRRLHEARLRMAQAAGLDPTEDMPFVAELIDVLPNEEHWRKAIETTLGGIARTVLVDRRAREHLSASIDGIPIRPRIRYQAVTLADHEDRHADPDRVSGKLAFKDSSFSHWVQARIESDDHLCVPNAAALSGPGPRVTPSGQTRDGDRGAHGESGDGNIIGFSNQRRQSDIESELGELEPQILTIRTRIRDTQTRIVDLRTQRDAHRYVQDAVWAGIDYLGIDCRIDSLQAEIGRLRETNELLDQIEREEERIKPLLTGANRTKVLAEEGLRAQATRFSGLVSEQDAVQNTIDAIDKAQTTTVTDEQQSHLDALFAGSWDVTSLSSFEANMTALRSRLRSDADVARKSAASAANAMSDMFERYKEQWTEHNLGTDVTSADGYREILDRILSEGLHERRNTWRREFAAWSSDDLLRLNDAFDAAREEIEDRLAPINRILETLPFGGKGILQINLRPLPSEDVRAFRRGLRELSSGLARELTDQQVETRFKKLHEFMAKISLGEGTSRSSTAQRDRYLDVRQHFVITAVCLDENRREIATYDSLGGKSGGETQELIAFIVGSALRYQLGDETRSRPTYAPVFLDEGFVKSDSEFAGRAVRAWQDLGFQLIIGAPLDKVTALEPHMDLLLNITKNEHGYSYVSDLQDATDTGVAP